MTFAREPLQKKSERKLEKNVDKQGKKGYTVTVK